MEYAPSSGNLEFSQDTVFLDTIFTNISSRTYSFTVRNTSKDPIEIPTIRLGNGQDSRYRLNVDGEAGKEFQNIPILAQDSIFIFIETTVPASAISEVEFLYTDAILFDSGSNQQQVQLVTLVKDAVFLFSNTLSDNTAASMASLSGDSACVLPRPPLSANGKSAALPKGMSDDTAAPQLPSA